MEIDGTFWEEDRLARDRVSRATICAYLAAVVGLYLSWGALSAGRLTGTPLSGVLVADGLVTFVLAYLSGRASRVALALLLVRTIGAALAWWRLGSLVASEVSCLVCAPIYYFGLRGAVTLARHERALVAS